VKRKGHIVQFSTEELMTLKSETDWAKADAMPQEEVERLADEEDGPLTPGWEDSIVLGIPEPKQDVHIRLDPAVLRWFKAAGPGYQTRINAVLRAFVQASQRKAQKSDTP
jgi:uncharacterized protein (DUF4415 family)